MTQFTYSADAQVAGYDNDQHVQYELIETPLSLGGSTEAKTHYDIAYNEITSSTVQNNAVFKVLNVPVENNLVISSSNLDAAIILSCDCIEYVGDGDTVISLRADRFGSQAFKRTMVETSSTSIEITGYGEGTLAADIYSDLSALVSGETEGATTQAFVTSSNWDIDSPSVTINPTLFASGYDWSGVSVMQRGRSDDKYPITLITPRHAICADHVKPPAGRDFLFRRSNGTFQKVQAETVTTVTSEIEPTALDLAVVYLDQEVTGITPYSVPEPGWIADHFPALANSLGFYGRIHAIPTLRKAAHLADGSAGSAIQINTIGSISLGDKMLNNITSPWEYTLAENIEAWGASSAIVGDSGGPSFLPYDGGLVLVSCQYTTTSANNIAEYAAEINAVMNDQAGTVDTYALTTEDFEA